MEIRKIRYDEYDMLMEVMNTSFNFVDDNSKFEHILPKLYFKDNKNMVHIGAFENDKLVSSIGLYLMDLINGDKCLHIACVGAVSTLPSYRNKGYFSKVINKILEIAQDMNLDMLFLGGNRIRYGHYGFENAGRVIKFNITDRNKDMFYVDGVDVNILHKDDTKTIKKLLDIYNKNKMRIVLNKNNFYDTLISWNAIPYYVTYKNEIVGYFAITENEIMETSFNDNIDIIFTAVNIINNNVIFKLPISFYDDIVNKCDWYVIEHNHMFNILNYKNVIEFLGKDYDNIYKSIENLDNKAKIRKILGDPLENSITGTNIFISESNAG